MLKWSSFTLKLSNKSKFTKWSGREFQTLVDRGNNEDLKAYLQNLGI